MVSSIGVGLGRNQLISGFGLYHHRIRRRATTGRGTARKAGAAVIRHVGHAIVDRIAGAVAGSGYKLAGGRHHAIRRPRSTLGMGRRRHVHRRLF